ncbi:MAG TPA: molybdopterin-dependent oxidoreductase [Acidimicrobiales bacterium]|nr:molybdopterin-dependent oxidoreductase [Acidimicrobiales bacterium]
MSSVRNSESSSTASPAGGRLPPGQTPVEGFPRFGTSMYRPPPVVPADPKITVSGVVSEPIQVAVADLAGMDRRPVVADFHCVAGWSALGLRWEGVAFENFYRQIIEPALAPGAAPTHFVFAGLDGWRSLVEIEDALDPDVLIADRLDGQPLDPAHGAPARLLSPAQYGFVSTKHLCRIEVHTARPEGLDPTAIRIGPLTLPNPVVRTHPRARVWQEERHPALPSWAARRLYRSLVAPIRLVLRAGVSRPARASESPAERPSGPVR